MTIFCLESVENECPHEAWRGGEFEGNRGEGVENRVLEVEVGMGWGEEAGGFHTVCRCECVNVGGYSHCFTGLQVGRGGCFVCCGYGGVGTIIIWARVLVPYYRCISTGAGDIDW